METQTGKITRPFFTAFLQNKLGSPSSLVLVGPRFGVDVSIIKLAAGQAMAVASDPVSLIPSLGLKESAYLSVHLAANDIATTGFLPQFGQFVLNLPADFSPSDFEIYWNYIHQFCTEIGIAITGGHTGFIEGQNSTIAGGLTLMTVAPESQLLNASMASSGDAILVTKNCGISSAAILAMSFPKTVQQKVGLEIYQKASESFYDISVIKEVQVLKGKPNLEVSAMHDVTEGGVLGAVYEMATASENGALIYKDKLPIGDIQKSVLDVFSLDSAACIGAGSMLITCKQNRAEAIIKQLKEHQINCCQIGEMVEQQKGVQMVDYQGSHKLEYKEKDPYWRAFFNALNAGWE